MANRGKKVERVGRWYDGSVASAGAACFTHPLDLLKVHLQERTREHVIHHEVKIVSLIDFDQLQFKFSRIWPL